MIKETSIVLQLQKSNESHLLNQLNKCYDNKLKRIEKLSKENKIQLKLFFEDEIITKKIFNQIKYRQFGKLIDCYDLSEQVCQQNAQKVSKENKVRSIPQKKLIRPKRSLDANKIFQNIQNQQIKKQTYQQTKFNQKRFSFKSKMERSNVILISNLDNFFDNSQQVYNLFKFFGSIKKILLMKNLQKVMIQFESKKSSFLAASIIDNLKLANSKLKVNYSKFQEIDLKKNNRNYNSVKFNDVMIPQEESVDQKRFNLKRNDIIQIITNNKNIESIQDKFKQSEVTLVLSDLNLKKYTYNIKFNNIIQKIIFIKNNNLDIQEFSININP